MTVPLAHVDAFTDQPFGGNPAAVCLLPASRDAGWMQHVAQEMNLAATAFLVPRRGDEFDLRWFTPAVELDLCGHATLVSAHTLWQRGVVPPSSAVRFHTRSGVLTAERQGDWIELNFPATPPTDAAPPPGLADALGVEPRYVGKSRFDYVIEIDGEQRLRELTPDFARLRTFPVRGVIVTSRPTTAEWDFVSRFFAPGSGIDEDPVTGSAHCCLGPYWSALLGKTTFIARQVSARGGTLRIRLDGDRVRLAGQAVTIFSGELVS